MNRYMALDQGNGSWSVLEPVANPVTGYVESYVVFLADLDDQKVWKVIRGLNAQAEIDEARRRED